MVNLIKNSVSRLYLLNCKTTGIIFIMLTGLNLLACKGKNNRPAIAADTTAAPAHYDLSAPQSITLGDKLHEISGLAYISEHVILGENDEQGRIFSIDPTQPDNTDYPSVRFAGKGDYEDIVVTGSTAYLLISDGEIVEVPDFSGATKVSGTVIARMGGKHNEFETLYYDKTVNSLIMLCKSCHHEKNEIRTAYRFDLAAKKFSDTAYFTISVAEIAGKINENSAGFFPSAAAIHPVSNNLYILSSIGKLLVITDRKGKVEEVYKLNPALFRQPEGITFAPNGDMFISNEGGNGKATLLKFSYKP